MRLHDFLDYWAREQGQAELARQDNWQMTYGQAQAETNRLANALIGAGLQIGDRLGLLAKNSLEYLLFYLAASKAGVVPVPLNYRLVPTEWRYILNDAGAKMIIAAADYLAGVETIRPELTTVERFIALNSPAREGWADYHEWLAG